MGRKAREQVLSHGGPLLRVKKGDLVDAGVDVVEHKVTGVQDGRPVLADGRVLDVRNVVWCTGFRHDMTWIEVPLEVDPESGLPVHDRGVTDQPGLYFVGLPFLSRFASTLVGGAGRTRPTSRDICWPGPSRSTRSPLWTTWRRRPSSRTHCRAAWGRTEDPMLPDPALAPGPEIDACRRLLTRCADALSVEGRRRDRSI